MDRMDALLVACLVLILAALASPFSGLSGEIARVSGQAYTNDIWPASIHAVPEQAYPGEYVEFGVVASDSASVAWSFGDGKAAQGRVAVHTYDKPGTYWVKATITICHGLFCSSKQLTKGLEVLDSP